MDFFPEIIKKEIIETLQYIGSKELQIEYQKNVPIIHVPIELVCQWFDDLYLPSSNFFISSFSPKQLDAMKVFNDYFDEQLSELIPDCKNYPFPEILEAEPWKKIMAMANETLKAFNL